MSHHSASRATLVALRLHLDVSKMYRPNSGRQFLAVLQRNVMLQTRNGRPFLGIIGLAAVSPKMIKPGISCRLNPGHPSLSVLRKSVMLQTRSSHFFSSITPNQQWRLTVFLGCTLTTDDLAGQTREGSSWRFCGRMSCCRLAVGAPSWASAA